MTGGGPVGRATRTSVEIVTTGPLATVQDLGRPGYAHLGVPRSGAADRGALRLANRLVGNPEGAAGIEVTLGGLTLTPDSSIIVAVTGAATTVSLDGRGVGWGAMIEVPAGARLTVDVPTLGARNYVAIRGGIDVDVELGSRATDTLSGVGPPPLEVGSRVLIGTHRDAWPTITQAPLDRSRPEVITLDAGPGPRRDLLAQPAMLASGVWEVSAQSNRVGVRLDRPTDSDAPLVRHRDDVDELRSEGVAHGAVQVPPTGRPVLFLADHPVTGGYPVVAVLTARSVDAAAQLVPGDRVRIRIR